jgi:hypothetical protein
MSCRFDIIGISRSSVCAGCIVGMPSPLNGCIPVDLCPASGIDESQFIIDMSSSPCIGKSLSIKISCSPGIGKSVVMAVMSTSSCISKSPVLDSFYSPAISDFPICNGRSCLTGRASSESLNRLFFGIRFSEEAGPASKYLRNYVIIKSCVSRASFWRSVFFRRLSIRSLLVISSLS